MTLIRNASASDGIKTGDRTGVGFFIPLTPELASQFPDLGANDRSDPHTTFLHVGHIPKEREAEFLAVTSKVFESIRGPVTGYLTELDYFTQPQKEQRVALMRVRFSHDLAGMRWRLRDALLEAGFAVDDYFPLVYSPHVTLAYMPGLEAVYTEAPPSGTWDFEGIEIWGLPKLHTVKFGHATRTASRKVDAMHQVSIELMKFLSSVSRKLGVAEHIYVVGGAVRNFVINEPIKDVDVVVDSVALKGKDSEWFAKKVQDAIPVPTNLTTNNYGVAILTIKGDWEVAGKNLAGEVIEIANARTESYSDGGYKPDDVAPATIVEDTYRREFTFNTLLWRMMDLANGPDKAEILDLTGCGLNDLKDGVMRCPSDPDKTFTDDPSRMIRALKFLLKYKFKIAPDVEASIKKNKEKLRNIPGGHLSNMIITLFYETGVGKRALLEMDRLGMLDVVKSIAQSDKPFREALANWAERHADLEFLFDLMDLGMPVGRRLGFLTGPQKERVREVTVQMGVEEGAEYVLFLEQPGKVINMPGLIQEFGLKGAEIKLLMDTARTVLLEDPVLAASPHRLEAQIRDQLVRRGKTATRTAGVLEAPPAMVAAIGEWIQAVVAANQMELKQSTYDSQVQNLKDLAAAMEPTLKRIEDYRRILPTGTSKALFAEAHVIWEEIIGPFGYVGLGEPKIKLFQKLDATTRPQLIATMENWLGIAEKTISDRVNNRHGIEKSQREMDELRPYIRPGISAQGTEATRKFPMDLTGWKYNTKDLFGILTGKTIEKLEKTIKEFEGFRRSEDIVNLYKERLEEAKRGDIGWKFITVKLTNANDIPNAGGQWQDVSRLLTVVIPNQVWIWSIETDLLRILRHELQHMAQSFLRVVFSDSDWIDYLTHDRKPGPGMPSRHIMTPRYHQEDKRTDPSKPGGYRRVEDMPPSAGQTHSLDDIEFHTELQDEIDEAKKMLKEQNGRKRDYYKRDLTPRERQDYLLAFMGMKEVEYFRDASGSFSTWKRFAPGKWKRAIKEFFRAFPILAQHLKADPPEKQAARVAFRWSVRRVAKTFTINEGDPILFGKFKNKRGIIRGFGATDRGDPTVTVETSSGAMQEVQLFKIREDKGREPIPQVDGIVASGKQASTAPWARLAATYQDQIRVKNAVRSEWTDRVMPSVGETYSWTTWGGGQYQGTVTDTDSNVLYVACTDGKTRVVEAAATYQKKKKVKTQDGEDMTVYEYSDKQIAKRHKDKAERIDGLRGKIDKLRAQYRKDLKAADDKTRYVALAIGLMDETYERVGNDESAKEGHFGVTGWQKKHISFSGSKAKITYVGKSGVDHVKEVTDSALVTALKAATKGKKDNDPLCEGEDCRIGAEDVNEYLEPFDVSAKDIRGFHANTEMQTRLKAVRSKGGKLPTDKKEREKKLKDEFKQALDETAEAVGHEAATLRSQYLVPGLEDEFMQDGSVSESLVKKGTKTPAEREDDQAEAMIHKSPKSKPPRQDLRKHIIKEDDPDADRGADEDPDKSKNYKKVASMWLESLNKRQQKKDDKKKQTITPLPALPKKKEEPEHKPGDVWKTEEGFAAKNPEGVTHAFAEEGAAKSYAQGGEKDEGKEDSKKKPSEELNPETPVEAPAEKMDPTKKLEGLADALENAKSKDIRSLTRELKDHFADDPEVASQLDAHLKAFDKSTRDLALASLDMEKSVKNKHKEESQAKLDAAEKLRADALEGIRNLTNPKKAPDPFADVAPAPKEEPKSPASDPVPDADTAMENFHDNSIIPNDLKERSRALLQNTPPEGIAEMKRLYAEEAKRLEEDIANSASWQKSDYTDWAERAVTLYAEALAKGEVNYYQVVNAALASYVLDTTGGKKAPSETPTPAENSEGGEAEVEKKTPTPSTDPVEVGGSAVTNDSKTSDQLKARSQKAYTEYSSMDSKERTAAALHIQAHLKTAEPGSPAAQELESLLDGLQLASLVEGDKDPIPGRPPASPHLGALAKALGKSNKAHLLLPGSDGFDSPHGRETLREALDTMDPKEVASIHGASPGDPIYQALTNPNLSKSQQKILSDFFNNLVVNSITSSHSAMMAGFTGDTTVDAVAQRQKSTDEYVQKSPEYLKASKAVVDCLGEEASANTITQDECLKEAKAKVELITLSLQMAYWKTQGWDPPAGHPAVVQVEAAVSKGDPSELDAKYILEGDDVTTRYAFGPSVVRHRLTWA